MSTKSTKYLPALPNGAERSGAFPIENSGLSPMEFARSSHPVWKEMIGAPRKISAPFFAFFRILSSDFSGSPLPIFGVAFTDFARQI